MRQKVLKKLARIISFASDIKRIVDAVIKREDIPKFCKVVSRQTIRDNGYNLNIPRYVDSSEKAESWDIYASMFGGIPMSEVREFEDFWKAFPTLQSKLFVKINDSYVSVKVENVNSAIANNSDVVNFENNYRAAFASFENYLKGRLLDNMMTLTIPKEEGHCR